VEYRFKSERLPPGKPYPQMGPDDERWITRWSRSHYPRTCPEFPVIGKGYVNEEPTNSYWMASLVDPLEDRFREGIRILDYGCGMGRLANFISGYLKEFLYLGVEPPGNTKLVTARPLFNHDPRIRFAEIGSPGEELAARQFDAAILGSVFTHLLPDTCRCILEHLLPIVEGGGIIIFSAFLDDKLTYYKSGVYGFPNCYHRAYLPYSWIDEMGQALGRAIRREGRFDCYGITTHFIFSIR